MNDPIYDHSRDRVDDWPPEGYEEPPAWTAALIKLARWYSETEYSEFLDDLVCVPSGDGFTVVTPEPFRAAYLNENHADSIAKALDCDPADVTIRPPKSSESRPSAGGVA